MNRTELNTIGEFGLIERIAAKNQTQNSSTVKSIGDDCAVIDLGTEFLLVSTDSLVEGIHFDLTYVPLQHLGYKAVSVNVSDIAAMNGKAEQIVISIAVSNRFSVEAIEALYEGILSACKDYKVDLVGGDTTGSRTGLVIGVTVIGRVAKDKVVYRSGAKPGDVVCVTGDLGGAYIGLQVLEREKQVYLDNPDMQPQIEEYDLLVGKQLRPIARMDIIHEFKEKGIVPTSMIDVSDGLASELLHIGKQSNVGLTIFEENLPIDNFTYETALEFKIGPTTCAMNGGEDYELLFTVSKEDYEKIKNHSEIYSIGQVEEAEKGLTLVSKKGQLHDIQAQGWNHFQK